MKNKSVKTMVASVLAVGLMMGIPASAFAVSPGGMSVPSAQSVDSSENCAQILDWLGIQIPRHFDSQAPYKINTLSESDPNYWQAEWETQVYNYKMVRNYPTLYTQDAWDAAQSAGTVMMGLHPESLTDANKQQILEARDAIAALADHQLKPYSDGINGEVIYLWGDDMPVTTLAEDLQFPLVNYEGESVYDNADFQPFLIPYLLDDPSSAKGTIIVASGGGNTSRSNPVEAYAVCPEFNKLGYNCFLLQRRVAPYNNDDIVMDMQRAVRYLRYNADSLGLGGMDCIAASGFSGGSGTILGEVANLYGDVQPTLYDADYASDAVDQMSADLDVVCPLYGPQYDGEHTSDYAGLVTENPNLPAMFLAVGENDATGAMPDIWTLANSVRGKTVVEVHTFAEVGHGFGAGLQGTTSTYWIPMADTFIDLVMGRGEAGVGEAAEIPEGYTQVQQYTFEGGFGKADVTCAVDDAKTKVYMTFVAFDQQQVVEGVLNDGIITVTYDQSGFMTNDAQAIYNAADQNNWQPVA